MRLVNWLENWEKGEQGRGYRRRRVKKKGGRGEVGCSQAERERVTVSLPIVRGAAASGAQKHSLRTVTPRYRATCANHWTVPLGHPCQSRAFVRSVYFVARPNIHVPAAPRFSCASTSYFVRFLCIIFIYRRLLYVYIYIYILYIFFSSIYIFIYSFIYHPFYLSVFIHIASSVSHVATTSSEAHEKNVEKVWAKESRWGIRCWNVPKRKLLSYFGHYRTVSIVSQKIF